MINDVSKLGFGANLFDSSNSIKKNSDASSMDQLFDNKNNKVDDFKSKLDVKTKAEPKNKLEPKAQVESKFKDEPKTKLEPKVKSEPKAVDTQKVAQDYNDDDSDETLPANGISEKPKAVNLSQPQQVAPNQPTNSKEAKVFETNEIKSKKDIGAIDDKMPVIKFMQFMKEKYNIDPEEIVNAMNNLSKEELMATPYDSMYAFFNKLGIPNENVAPAKEQYLNMLSELNKIENTKLVTNDVKVEVLDPKKQRVQELNRKLDQMNASFFVSHPVKNAQTQPLSVNAEGLENKLSPENFFVDNKSNSIKQNVNVKSQEMVETTPAPVVYKPQQVDVPQPAEILTLEEQQMPAISEDGMQLEQLKDLAKQNEMKLDILELSSQINNIEKSMSNSDMKNEDAEQNLDNQNYLSGVPQDKQVESKATVSQFANELKATDRTNQNENIKNLINQAQIMIKKGGGEMKIQMHPEGIGNVNLKVKVEEGGKVGIQMTADTADAKRLLEGSLQDLRSHLAQHKMSVDTFKVDVSDKFSDGLNQQNDLNREEARSFLGQFREQNQQFRNPFQNDNPGMRMYRSYGGKTPENRPQESVSALAPRKNSSGRIHLVA